MSSSRRPLPLSVRRDVDGSIEFRWVSRERAWDWATWGAMVGGVLGFYLFVTRDWMIEFGFTFAVLAFLVGRLGAATRVLFDPARARVVIDGKHVVPAADIEGVFVGHRAPKWYSLSGSGDYYVYVKHGEARIVLTTCESKSAATELADELRGTLEGVPVTWPTLSPRLWRWIAVITLGLALLLLLTYGVAPWLIRPLQRLPTPVTGPEQAIERLGALWEDTDRVSFEMGGRYVVAVFYGPTLVTAEELWDGCPNARRGATCSMLYVFEDDSLAYFVALEHPTSLGRLSRGEIRPGFLVIDAPRLLDPERRAWVLRQRAIAERGWDWWLREPKSY